MNRIVLDASALLALLNRESGAEKLTPQLLSTAISSTVNLAEVHAKLVERGLSPRDAWEATLSPIREAAPFTAEHAKIAGTSSPKPAASACPWEIGLAWPSDLPRGHPCIQQTNTGRN